jgi:co-chaperonin GroES (HSP10)
MTPRGPYIQLDVKEIEWKTQSGIDLSASAKNVIEEYATVLDVGGLVTDIKKGDIVYFKEYNLDRVEVGTFTDKNTLYFIDEMHVLAVKS